MCSTMAIPHTVKILAKIDHHTLNHNDLVYIIDDDRQYFAIVMANKHPEGNCEFISIYSKPSALYNIGHNNVLYMFGNNANAYIEMENSNPLNPELILSSYNILASDIKVGDFYVDASGIACINVIDHISGDYDYYVLMLHGRGRIAVKPNHEYTILRLQTLGG